jgi:hypothetical protein
LNLNSKGGLVVEGWRNVDLNKMDAYFKNPRGTVALGVDGYVDEVWEVVAARTQAGCDVYRELQAFGQVLVACGAGGVSTEILRKRRTYGGFTANTGEAVARLGLTASLVGLYGQEGLDPVFRPLAGLGALYSIGDPAVSHIYEFQDGKLMLVYLQEILDIGWDTLLAALGRDRLGEIFGRADIIALGYWSNMPAFDDLAAGICGNFLSAEKPQQLFLDLADIRKRDRDSLRKTLGGLKEINPRLPVLLSLNEHEAALLAAAFGETFPQSPGPAQGCLARLARTLGLAEVVVHTPAFAAGVSAAGETAALPQRFCPNPVRTTGAGDHFNAGYLAASLGLSLAEKLAAGNAAVSFFLRTGASADAEGLRAELAGLGAELGSVGME